MMQDNARQKALKLFQQGHYSKARGLYEKMYKRNSNDAEALYMLGSIHGQAGEYKRAAQYFKKTLGLQPDAFVAICGLGAAYKELGEYADAENAFKQAIILQPDNIELMLEIAGTYLLQGKIEDAESTLRDILSKQPASADALHGLGEVLHSRQQLDFAEDYYQQALAIQPKRSNTLNRLGHINHTRGHLEAAIAYYEKAISILPNNSDYWKNLSQSQLLHGDIEDALKSIERALKLKPDDITANAIKAGIFEKLGDVEAAYGIIKPVLNKRSLHTGVAIVFASICQKLGQCDKAIDYIDTILDEPGIPASSLESVHYSAGKLFDKLGNYDRAFSHFEAANNIRPSRYRHAEHTAIVDAIMRVFDWGFLSTAPVSLSGNRERPLLIVGMPRSGTSLIEQILDSHADITGAGELADIESITMEIVNRIDPEKGFPHGLRNISSDILDPYATSYLDKLSSISPQSRYVSDKMPQNFIHLGLISLMLPKARIVHCVRNPIDTCLSIYFQYFNESHEYATRLEDIANYYREYRRLMAHWKAVLKLPIYDVSYDEIVNTPEPCIRDLLGFLDVEWDENCLMFHKSSRHVATASYEQVTQALYTSSHERWKHYKNHVSALLELLSPYHDEAKI